MQPTNFTLTKAGGQPRKPRNQAEFRSVYIADLARAAEANDIILSNPPELPIPAPTSRVGKKTLRKTFDADCRRLRREAGVPARSGPPIPGSEQTGHRRWYTLAQCRHGGRLSGVARRDQAMPRWERIQQLHYRRHSLRTIARQVGLSHAQVGRVVAGRLWRMDGSPKQSPSMVVVNSVRGTPRQDWAVKRFGGDPPSELRELREDAAEAVVATCVPPGLAFGSTDGTAAREAMRRWFHTSVAPVGRQVEAELRAKLEEPGLTLSFPALETFASDTVGKARTVGQLVQAGLEVEDALVKAGFD